MNDSLCHNHVKNRAFSDVHLTYTASRSCFTHIQVPYSRTLYIGVACSLPYKRFPTHSLPLRAYVS